jgi:predicted secreted protein
MLYSGVTGKISIKKGTAAAVDLLHMANWSVELSKEILEVISFGNDYKEKVPSIKDWSASTDGTADFAADSGQAMLLKAFDDGELLTGSFYLDDNTFLVGSCYIESLSIEHAADGKADISISLSGSGGVLLNGAETPPSLTMVSVLPAADATGVLTSASITLTFSNEISDDNIFLINSPGGTVVPCTKTWNAAKTMCTLKPNASLDSGERHAIIVANITDIFGQSLTDTASYFTTA